MVIIYLWFQSVNCAEKCTTAIAGHTFLAFELTVFALYQKCNDNIVSVILNSIQKGSGKPILLLHGMAASVNYWHSYFPLLSKTRKVIAVDLLGFGRSPQSTEGYSVEAHCRAIKDTLLSLNINEPVTIMGHSMGALLALQYAIRYPGEISDLILISMPIYKNEAEAKIMITKSRKILAYTYYGPTSYILCTSWCYYLRPISKRVAPLYLPYLPRQVARDSVLHTFKSYSESLRSLVETQSVEDDLKKLKIPAVVVYGNADETFVLDNVHSMKQLSKNISIELMDGSHQIPLEHPEQIMKLIH